MDELQVNTVYMRQDTRIAQYLPYPQYLLALDISGTTKVLYALLLNRATLSQKNTWLDEEGKVYIIYTIDAMAEDLRKSRTTIKHALSELDGCGLLERRPVGFGKPNHLYVKLLEGRFSDKTRDRNLALYRQENGLQMRKNSVSNTGGMSPPNNYKNNSIQNNLNGVMEERTAYGRYQNIFLTDVEYAELQADFPEDLDRFMEEMSNYLAASGKIYANYAAGFRVWASKDKKSSMKKPDFNDYSCEGGREFLMKDRMGLKDMNFPVVELKNGDFMKDGLLHCGVCGEPRERRFPESSLLLGRIMYKHPSACFCERKAREADEKRLREQQHEAEVQRLKEKCFDHRIMASWTFDQSILEEQKLKIGRKYVEKWLDVRENNLGLLLWGKVGTGKTYFATAIANALLQKEVPVRMTNLAAIMNCRYEERAELIKSFNRFDLLIIDDFGMERDTSFGMETVYQVIDGRYLDHKPLILTTNLSLEALKNPIDLDHRRIYDRVLEMTTGVRFLGTNLREERSRVKKETIGNILK